MKYLLISLSILFLGTDLIAQVDWKFQVTKFVDDAGSPTPANNNHYHWNEQTDLRQGIRINLKPDPSVNAKVYVEANNSRFRFHHSEGEDSQSNKLRHVSVSVNGGAYQTLYNGNIFNYKLNVYWTSSSAFSTVGNHTLTVKFKRAISGITYTRYRHYDIKVVAKSDELHLDQYRNSIRVWKSDYPNAKPFLVSVGLDAHNIWPEQFQRYNVGSLFDCLLDNSDHPHDVYVLYYRYNPQDMRNNAAVYHSAVTYVSNQKYGGKKIVAGGRSMGGIISRYALAKAEEEGQPLPVSTWFTLDSPHQGANVSAPVLDFFKSIDVATGTFLRKTNDNPAAKIMLKHNPYDPDGAIHNAFYNELNDLNGDGFPHLTHNIGVSFGNKTPNPNSGIWVSLNLFGLPIQSFEMTAEDRKAGSLVPRTNVDLFEPVLAITQTKDPTFMDIKSALDINDNDNNPYNDLNNSRFDAHVFPGTTHFHDIFPSEIATALATELVAPEKMYLQDVEIKGKGEYRVYEAIHVGTDVRSDRFNGPVNIDAQEMTFKAGDMVLFESNVLIKSSSKFLAKIELTASPDCAPYENTNELPPAFASARTANEMIGTNMEQMLSSSTLRVFPNPVMTEASIEFVLAESGSVQLDLINAQGQTIKNIWVTKYSDQIQQQIDLDLSDLAPGMYFVQLATAKEQLRKKIIKL
ncbi:MAG: T9SS type A sorting domain-containing protein [Bacteroidota bacterium]